MVVPKHPYSLFSYSREFNHTGYQYYIVGGKWIHMLIRIHIDSCGPRHISRLQQHICPSMDILSEVNGMDSVFANNDVWCPFPRVLIISALKSVSFIAIRSYYLTLLCEHFTSLWIIVLNAQMIILSSNHIDYVVFSTVTYKIVKWSSCSEHK